jgi:hypothetical protein
MKTNENPYSILVPYLPTDSFELLRSRIVPEAAREDDPARGGRKTFPLEKVPPPPAGD